MRLFLAFKLPRETEFPIQQTLQSFKRSYPTGVNWVTTQHLHFTVQFMGEIRANDLPRIKEYLAEEGNRLSPVSVAYQGCQIYPSNQPRLVWLKWHSEDKQIIRFTASFRRFLQELDYETDTKPLQFHITLGRIKQALPVHAEREINSTQLPLTNYELKELVLFESKLTPTGPIYRELEHYSLDKSGGT